MRVCWLLLTGAYALLVPAAAAAVARVTIVPAEATLIRGGELTFQARAFDRQGNLIPDVTFKFRSSAARVLAVAADGAATGQATGTARVTARVGKKTATAVVQVVGAPAGGGSFVATEQLQVNHVATDGEWVYWTELHVPRARLRRAPVGGGGVFDVVSERAADESGRSITYAQLQVSGDRVFFSRAALKLGESWSLWSVDRAGGPARRVVPERAGVNPLLISGWRVVGRYIVVALRNPEEVGLPAATRLGALDTETREWAPLLTDGFQRERVRILATDGEELFIRAVTERGDTQILRMNPSGPPNTFERLFSDDGVDQLIDVQGAVDVSRVYFWSRKSGGTSRLRSVLRSGGGAATLREDESGVGLIADGNHLYWCRDNGAVVRIPAAGGPVEPFFPDTFRLSTTGGLAHDAGSLYLTLVRNRHVDILRVPK